MLRPFVSGPGYKVYWQFALKGNHYIGKRFQSWQSPTICTSAVTCIGDTELIHAKTVILKGGTLVLKWGSHGLPCVKKLIPNHSKSRLSFSISLHPGLYRVSNRFQDERGNAFHLFFQKNPRASFKMCLHSATDSHLKTVTEEHYLPPLLSNTLQRHSLSGFSDDFLSSASGWTYMLSLLAVWSHLGHLTYLFWMV